MDWSNVAVFAATEFLLCMTPGPAVMLVIGLSMRQGFVRSQYATLGILAANALYFALSAAGVASLILASATLFMILKYVGAAYLAFLGLRMVVPLIQKWRSGEKDEAGFDARGAASTPQNAVSQPRKLVWKGFALQAANPKNLAFFVAILPQFIQPDGPIALQMTVLGVVSVLLELPILIVYALAFSSLAKVMTRYAVLWFEAIAGSILIMLGGALAWSRRA